MKQGVEAHRGAARRRQVDSVRDSKRRLLVRGGQRGRRLVEKCAERRRRTRRRGVIGAHCGRSADVQRRCSREIGEKLKPKADVSTIERKILDWQAKWRL